MPKLAGTFSILYRVQRIVTEYTYVSVMVNDDVMTPKGKLDVEKIGERALEHAQLPQAIWYPEDERLRLHPIQQPQEPGTKSLLVTSDGYHYLEKNEAE